MARNLSRKKALVQIKTFCLSALMVTEHSSWNLLNSSDVRVNIKKESVGTNNLYCNSGRNKSVVFLNTPTDFHPKEQNKSNRILTLLQSWQ